MTILPSVLHGLATYAGFLESLTTRLLESRMRRYGAALLKAHRRPSPGFKPSQREIAANRLQARRA
jgi:hypothetical protein